MIIFYLISLLFVTFHVNAQDDIKKIIYDDLFTLNDLYNGCLISYTQNRILINELDTINEFNNIETIQLDYKSRVNIVKIDSIDNYYHIKVQFDLIAGPRYRGLFDSNTFNYVLYKIKKKYYKIDGFFESEIISIKKDIGSVRKLANITAPKKIENYIKLRKVDKIKNYLSISVLKKINEEWNYHINYRPYIIDLICW